MNNLYTVLPKERGEGEKSQTEQKMCHGLCFSIGKPIRGASSQNSCGKSLSIFLREPPERAPERAYLLHAPQAQRAGEAFLVWDSPAELGHLKQNRHLSIFRLPTGSWTSGLTFYQFPIWFSPVWSGLSAFNLFLHHDSTHDRNRTYRDAQIQKLYTSL